MQPFEPLTLNDETVQAIYDRCLANDDTPEEDRAQSMAFLGVCGYARDVFQKVFFSRARIAEDRKTLYYLYGQLAGVHEPEDLPYAPHPTLSISGCMRDYRGETWFRDRKSLLMLLTVGAVFLCDTPISGFTSKAYSDGLDNNVNRRLPELQRQISTSDVTFLGEDVIPTLSPDDPAFPAWWERHKAEWV